MVAALVLMILLVGVVNAAGASVDGDSDWRALLQEEGNAVDATACGCKNRSANVVALVGFETVGESEQARVVRAAFLEAGKQLRISTHVFLPGELEMTRKYFYDREAAFMDQLGEALALPELHAIVAIVADPIPAWEALAAAGVKTVTLGAGARTLLNATAADALPWRPVVHVGVDEYEAGFGLGVRAARAGGTAALCIVGRTGVQSLEQRCEGFAAGFKNDCSGGGPCAVRRLELDGINSFALANGVLDALEEDPSANTIAVSSGFEANALRQGLEGLDAPPRLYVLATDADVEAQLRDNNVVAAVDRYDYLAGYLGTVLATVAASTGQQLANRVIETGPEFRYAAAEPPNLRIDEVRLESIQHGLGADGFWLDYKKGMVEATRDLGLDFEYCPLGGRCQSPVPDGTVTYHAPEYDLNEMSSLIDSAGANRPHGMFLSVPNREVLEDSIRTNIKDRGVPTISINAGGDIWEELGMQMHVGQDEVVAGSVAGAALAAAGATRALCVNHNEGNVSIEQRCRGALEGMARSLGVAPDPALFEVVVVSFGSVADLRKHLIARIEEDATIDAVLCPSAVMCSLSRAELATAGLADRVKLACFDVLPETIEGIVAGDILFTIQQQQQLQSYLPTTLLALRATTGQMVRTGYLLTGPALIYASNTAAVTCQHDLACDPEAERSSAAPGCARPAWRGDGWCDAINNDEDCGFDGGDCCEESCAAPLGGAFRCGADHFARGLNNFDCRDPATAEGLARLCAQDPESDGCAPPERDPRNLRVGVLVRASESVAEAACVQPFGTWENATCWRPDRLALARLATAHFNARNSTVMPHLGDALLAECNKQIELVVSDTEGTEAATVDGVLRLARDLGADVLVGPESASDGIVSSAALLAGVYARPLVAHAASSAQLDDAALFPTALRTGVDDDRRMAAVCALWRDLGYRYAAILAPSNSLGEAFKRAAATDCQGVQVSSFSYEANSHARSINAGELARLAASGLNVVLFVVAEAKEVVATLLEDAFDAAALRAGTQWTFSSAAVASAWTFVERSDVRQALDGSAAVRASSARTLQSRAAFQHFEAAWQPAALDPRLPDAYDLTQSEAFAETLTNMYDAMMLAGRLACLVAPSQRLQDNFTDSFLRVVNDPRAAFDGLSGRVALDAGGGRAKAANGQGNEMELVVLTQQAAGSGFEAHLQAVLTGDGRLVRDCSGCEAAAAAVFNGGRSEVPANVVVPAHDLGNADSRIKVICRALAGIDIMLAALFFVGTVVYSKHPLVRAAQTPFLRLICLGAMLSAMAIVPVTMDDSAGPVATEEGGNASADRMCMLAPWLYTLGFVLTMGALLVKLNRVSRVFDVSTQLQRDAKALRRLSVAVLLKQIVYLLVVDAGVMLLWTLLSPLKFKRSGYERDAFGNPTRSVWHCTSEHATVFIGIGVTFHLILLLLAAYLSQQTAGIHLAFAEGKYISIAVVSSLQINLLALPLVMAVADDATMRNFVLSGVIFLDTTAVLLVLFVPKIYFAVYGVTEGGLGGEALHAAVSSGNTPSTKRVMATSMGARTTTTNTSDIVP